MEEIQKTQSYRMWRALFAVQGGITDVLLARFINEAKDLSFKEHMVMRKVHTMMETTPQGIPLKDLAAALHLTPGTVSELVEKLDDVEDPCTDKSGKHGDQHDIGAVVV